MPILGALKAALGYGDAAPQDQADPCIECNLRCASASVTPHEVHVLVRLPPPDDAGSVGSAWWPETLGDRLAAYEAILADKKIKATAFEYPDDREFQHEAFVFSRTRDVATHHVVAQNQDDLVKLVRKSILRDGEEKPEATGTAREAANVEKTFIVCAHGARDERCGQRGPVIARALAASEEKPTVLLSSHVGGHVYAGNVIVWGGSASGTWFGGIHELLVPKLLAGACLNSSDKGDLTYSLTRAATRSLGLKEADEQGIDAAQCESLRPYWRGTAGRSKEEQAKHFARCGGDMEDMIETF